MTDRKDSADPATYYLIERNDRGHAEWLVELLGGSPRIGWTTNVHEAKRFDWWVPASRYIDAIKGWPEMAGIVVQRTEHMDMPPPAPRASRDEDRHHAGQWWYMDAAGKITYSHDRDSLIAWRDGARGKFGPGQDCYDLEAGDTLDFAFCVPPPGDGVAAAEERAQCIATLERLVREWEAPRYLGSPTELKNDRDTLRRAIHRLYAGRDTRALGARVDALLAEAILADGDG